MLVTPLIDALRQKMLQRANANAHVETVSQKLPSIRNQIKIFPPVKISIFIKSIP